MIVQISRDNYDIIISQARKEFPLECCGLIGGLIEGDILSVKSVFPLYNMDQSSEHFSMDPKEQFKVIKELRKESYILLGNYHSHPYTPSRPSEEDKKLAYDDAMIYGIVSLAEDEPVFNFFRILGQKEVEKLMLEII